MVVNFCKVMTVLSIVDAASAMHTASQIPNQTSHTLRETFTPGWLQWTNAPKCFRVGPQRAQSSREFFDQAEGRGIVVDPFRAEAYWHMEQVENHARYLRVVCNRTLEDTDIDEADFQQLLDELTRHNGYLPIQWLFWITTAEPRPRS